MINLIPPKGHTALKHEYVLRVGTIYGFLLAGVFAGGAALLVPTYVLTSSQLTGARDQSAEMEETKKMFNAAFEEIKTANTIMAQLRREEPSVPMTEIVEDIIRVAPGGIKFNAFQLAREGSAFKTITVQGVADTRLSLATFKIKIEESSLFKEAVVPIADLARDTNLPFSIAVTLEDVPKDMPATP